MKAKIQYSELLTFMSEASKLYLGFDESQSLPGKASFGGLTEGERKALAFLQASLTVWNRRTLLKESWHEELDLEPLELTSDAAVE